MGEKKKRRNIITPRQLCQPPSKIYNLIGVFLILIKCLQLTYDRTFAHKLVFVFVNREFRTSSCNNCNFFSRHQVTQCYTWANKSVFRKSMCRFECSNVIAIPWKNPYERKMSCLNFTIHWSWNITRQTNRITVSTQTRIPQNQSIPHRLPSNVCVRV